MNARIGSTEGYNFGMHCAPFPKHLPTHTKRTTLSQQHAMNWKMLWSISLRCLPHVGSLFVCLTLGIDLLMVPSEELASNRVQAHVATVGAEEEANFRRRSVNTTCPNGLPFAVRSDASCVELCGRGPARFCGPLLALALHCHV